MAAQLFGIKPYDPRILLVTTAALAFTAFLAAVYRLAAQQRSTRFALYTRNNNLFSNVAQWGQKHPDLRTRHIEPKACPR